MTGCGRFLKLQIRMTKQYVGYVQKWKERGEINSLANTIGKGLMMYLYSNAPVGFYKRKERREGERRKGNTILTNTIHRQRRGA
jgi:hypothetical protein